MVVIDKIDLHSIKQQMIQIITSQIKTEDLKKHLVSFINEKEHFPFAHLSYVHHEAFEGKDEEIVKLGAAIEILLLSFDMLDDLEDLDNMDEPWMKINHSIALNAATTLYALSQQAIFSLSSTNKYRILEEFTRFSIQAMEGQHIDLENSMSTEEECLRVIKNKSGSLIALSAVSGMLLAGANEPKVEAYGYQLGIAAQIDNDFRDLFNPRKNDISAQKKSLAYLYLQKKYNNHALDILEGIESGKPINEYFGSKENFKQKLIDAGVAQYLNVMKQIAVNRATRLINELPIKTYHIEKLKSQLII